MHLCSGSLLGLLALVGLGRAQRNVTVNSTVRGRDRTALISQDTSRISYTPAVCASGQTACIGWQPSTPAPADETIRYTTYNRSSTVSFRFTGSHRTASERDLTAPGTALYFVTTSPGTLTGFYCAFDGVGTREELSYLPGVIVNGFAGWSRTGLDPSATHVFSASLDDGSQLIVSSFMCVAMLWPS